MKTSFVFLRHAEVEPKFHRIFGGRLDMGLSELGLDQSRRLAAWLKRFPFDAVYASPMKRVQLTLQPFRDHARVEPKVLHDLREVDFGDWTGLAWSEVHDRFGVSAYDWLHVLGQGGFPNGETGEQLLARTKACLHHMLEEHRGRTVAVFAHGGVIRALLSELMGMPIHAMERIEIDYAGATWVDVGEMKGGRPRTEIQLLNFTPWRDL